MSFMDYLKLAWAWKTNPELMSLLQDFNKCSAERDQLKADLDRRTEEWSKYCDHILESLEDLFDWVSDQNVNIPFSIKLRAISAINREGIIKKESS